MTLIRPTSRLVRLLELLLPLLFSLHLPFVVVLPTRSFSALVHETQLELLHLANSASNALLKPTVLLDTQL